MVVAYTDRICFNVPDWSKEHLLDDVKLHVLPQHLQQACLYKAVNFADPKIKNSGVVVGMSMSVSSIVVANKCPQ
jgi:hypothetical protein